MAKKDNKVEFTALYVKVLNYAYKEGEDYNELTKEEIKKVVDDYFKENGQEKKIVKDSVDLEEKRLFTKIDDVIAYLKEKEKEGYTHIEQIWTGYEDNYFAACKDRLENDEEQLERVIHDIFKALLDASKVARERKAKEQKIAELKKEISKLEKETK